MQIDFDMAYAMSAAANGCRPFTSGAQGARRDAQSALPFGESHESSSVVSNPVNNQMRLNEGNRIINRYLFWRHVSSIIQPFHSFWFEWPNREASARRCL